MKYLFIILLLIVSCADGGGNKFFFPGATVVSDGPDIIQPLPVIPEDPPVLGTVKMVITNNMGTHFYDGTNVWTFNEIPVKRAQSGVYAIDTVLYSLDGNGNTVSSKNLVVAPDLIGITDKPQLFFRASASLFSPIPIGDIDIWIVENITPEEAEAGGGLYKPYTKIYLNAAEHGNWLDRQYEVDKLVVHKNDIYARIKTSAWKHINGDKKNVGLVIESGFALYDFDGVNRTATIDGITVTYSQNFFNAAKEWQKSGNVWYSQNGYSWDGIELVQTDLVMAAYRQKANVMIAVGKRYENGEDVLYWIDCSLGQVYRHIISVNQVNAFMRLYAGDGRTETGTYYKTRLRPAIVDDGMYFMLEDTAFKYDFKNGIVSIFAEGVQEIMPY